MTNDTLLDSIASQAANVAPIGSTLKFVLSDDMIIYIDGTGEKNFVSNKNEDAACTITTDMETLVSLRTGDLNPMMAVMSGKVKIKGDMGLAMKIQSLIQ